MFRGKIAPPFCDGEGGGFFPFWGVLCKTFGLGVFFFLRKKKVLLGQVEANYSVKIRPYWKLVS